MKVEWEKFDPWRIQPVAHTLGEHYLLQADQLLELGKRLDEQGRVRTHSNDVTAGTPFNDAPSLHPNRKSARDTIARIREAAAWTSLLNVQSDPTYRKLVDEVLDELKPQVERQDPGMCYRAGWIFITSPRTVTPFHMDKEHNFIMQVHGRKTLYVWDHRDTEVVSELARDRFHRFHKRDLVVWKDEFKSRAHIFHLEPGVGAYMPSTSPHMVENGDDASITISFTYYTDATRRDSLLHTAHDWMRDRGMNPQAVGASPASDSLVHAAARMARFADHARKRVTGTRVFQDDVQYAIPDAI